MPQISASRTLYSGWSTLSLATVEMDDGRIAERLIEDHGRAVAVLPYDPTRKMAILVRQFRAPVCATVSRTELLEAIAGLTDGEPGGTAGKREAFEETGLRLGALEHIATVWTMPGLSTERMDLFLACYTPSDRTGSGGGHPAEHENITVVELPLAELARMADEGALDDMKTFALVQSLRLRKPNLFLP
jgi:nudix-type nucleoside diphosphatase (YffH/AdpP family)